MVAEKKVKKKAIKKVAKKTNKTHACKATPAVKKKGGVCCCVKGMFSKIAGIFK